MEQAQVRLGDVFQQLQTGAQFCASEVTKRGNSRPSSHLDYELVIKIKLIE